MHGQQNIKICKETFISDIKCQISLICVQRRKRKNFELEFGKYSFELRPGRRPSWVRIFVVFLSPFRQLQEWEVSSYWAASAFLPVLTSASFSYYFSTLGYTARAADLLTYLLTPWSRVLLEKLTGLQLVKKFPAFYGTQRFITAFTSARHLALSWASPGPRLCLWIFRNKIPFNRGKLLALRPSPKLEDHPLSAVRDCLFNIFAATLHMGGLSSIRIQRKRHPVVTGTHSSHGPELVTVSFNKTNHL